MLKKLSIKSLSMIKNYLKVAIRNLLKSKVFSFINILGLSMGITCSLLIALWVKDERNVDAYHKNGNRLYIVYEKRNMDGKMEAGYYTPGMLALELKKVIPGIQYATGFGFYGRAAFEADNKQLIEEGHAAGPDFFKMFSYPLLQGAPEDALKDISAIAISRTMARSFFGSPESAIGRTLRFKDKRNFTVTAVFEDLPANSSDKFDYIINWNAFMDDNPWAKDWGNNGPGTYIMLQPDVNSTVLATKISHFLDGYNKEQNEHFRIQLALQPFPERYLHSNFENGEISGGRIEYVRIFSIVAVFILLIACINFMNLTTARSLKRAKEIGVRKVIGAVKSLLVWQFIGEAILMTALAVIISLVLMLLTLPLFNELTGKQISPPFMHGYFWIFLIGLTLFTGLVAGSYPALFLSSFNPIDVLKKTMKLSIASIWFRKGLVIFQFVLSLFLIIGTIIISRQVKYVQTKNIGYDKENLIYIPVDGTLVSQYGLFKEEASRIPGVKSISRLSQAPTLLDNKTGGVDWSGKNPSSTILFTYVAAGYDLVKTLNLKMVEGRDFSKNFATDSIGYIVNEKALQLIGYKDPIGQPLSLWGKRGTIIGVVKDFNFNSLHEQISPLIICLNEKVPIGAVLIKAGIGQTKTVLNGVEGLWKQLNPAFPFTYRFSDEEYLKLYRNEQIVTKLSDFFAFLAIFITSLGLLGLAFYTAEQRIKEIGIRKILGASTLSLFRLLSKEFLQLVIIAILIASPLAWLAAVKWLSGYAYRTDISWWIFVWAAFLAAMVTMLTVCFLALKTIAANPIKSLRTD